MTVDGSKKRTISLVEIQDAHLAYITSLRDEAARIFDSHVEDNSLATQTLKRLFRYMSERSQAVSFLTSYEYAWDAEIVLRSFYDTTAKIVFLCRAEASQKDDLVKEYWDGLGLSGDRRRARQAGFARKAHPRDPDSARVFEFLQSPRALRDAEDPGNRASRKAIDRKWSFTEIMEALDKELPGARSLLHNYGIASSLLHVDPGALELMMDRELREPGELQLLRASHACRIFSDQISLWYLCVASLARHFDDKSFDAANLRTGYEACCAMSEAIRELFARTQDEFYSQELKKDEPSE